MYAQLHHLMSRFKVNKFEINFLELPSELQSQDHAKDAYEKIPNGEFGGGCYSEDLAGGKTKFFLDCDGLSRDPLYRFNRFLNEPRFGFQMHLSATMRIGDNIGSVSIMWSHPLNSAQMQDLREGKDLKHLGYYSRGVETRSVEINISASRTGRTGTIKSIEFTMPSDDYHWIRETFVESFNP